MTLDTQLVDDSALHQLQSRKPLGEYVKDLWHRRHFIQTYAKSTAFAGGRDTFLGKLWLILDPIMQVGIYLLVFGFIMKTSRGIENFLGFLVIGVIFFKVLSAGVNSGNGLIQRSRSLISSFIFPRAAVGVSTTLKSFYDNLIPCALAVIFSLITQWGTPVSFTVLGVIPLYILMHIFALGATLFVARITAFVPDLMQLVRFTMQALFFLSGIFFSLERFESAPLIQEIMRFNPFYQFLYAIRECVLYGSLPGAFTTIYLTVWSFGLAIFGFIFFWQAESRYNHVK